MKFSANQIHDIDTMKGIFDVEKTSGNKLKVDLGSEGMPACTCKDWVRHHIKTLKKCCTFKWQRASSLQWEMGVLLSEASHRLRLECSRSLFVA